jgi:hypothetical protein
LQGLDHPTPTIDRFFKGIFNDDQALIGFMQSLWGYSINGRTSAEIMVFFLGSGGKPRSLPYKNLSKAPQKCAFCSGNQ